MYYKATMINSEQYICKKRHLKKNAGPKKRPLNM